MEPSCRCPEAYVPEANQCLRHPPFVLRPILRRHIDQVAHRVLGIGVAVQIPRQHSEPSLDLRVGPAFLQMRAEEVAEEQRVTLVRASLDADVNVDSPLAFGLDEEGLAPFGWCRRETRHLMVAIDVGASTPGSRG